jgi:hypothetical protein
MPEPPSNDIGAFNTALADEVRNYLLELVEDDERLGRYVRDRIAFLREENKLSLAAQDFLCETDYARIQHVMSHHSSPPARWLVIWLV